jgi:hypothetical protein
MHNYLGKSFGVSLRRATRKINIVNTQGPSSKVPSFILFFLLSFLPFSLFFFLSFFLFLLETQGFELLVRQVLYNLNHTPSPFSF